MKVKNIIAALTGKHRDRDCQISFKDLGISQLDVFTGLMQVPFRMLTHLELSSRDELTTAISEIFWVDLPHFDNHSASRISHFRHYQTYFY